MLIDTTILEPRPGARFTRWGFDCPIAECPDTGARLKVRATYNATREDKRMMTTQQIAEQLAAVREQLDRADDAARPIGHILIALATLTDIVERLAAKEEA